jgi:hypothetical protein
LRPLRGPQLPRDKLWFIFRESGENDRNRDQ